MPQAARATTPTVVCPQNAPAELRWFKVFFTTGEPDSPTFDFHIVRAGNPVEAAAIVVRHERSWVSMCPTHAPYATETVRALRVDELPAHCHPGEIDG